MNKGVKHLVVRCAERVWLRYPSMASLGCWPPSRSAYRSLWHCYLGKSHIPRLFSAKGNWLQSSDQILHGHSSFVTSPLTGNKEWWWVEVACFQTLLTWRRLSQYVTHTWPLMSPKKFHAVHAAGFLGISSVSRWRYISLQEPNQAVNEHVMMAHIDWGNGMKSRHC